MSLLNQPNDGHLGEILISKLERSYKHLTIISAFAKNSGVLKLKASLDAFRVAGGTVDAFIGIDLHGTSVEALQNLYEICNSLYIIHDENPYTTFHSKIYMLDDGSSAWIAVGSNNLTGGGLWDNNESSILDTIDFKSKEFKQIIALIEEYKTPTCEFSKKINSLDDISELKEAGYIWDEFHIKIQTAKEHNGKKASGRSKPLFGRSSNSRHRRSASGRMTKPFNATSSIDIENRESNRMWFQTSAMTGGSGNQLDLSREAKLLDGAVTPYFEKTSKSVIKGGVSFFDVDQDDLTIHKEITVNYKGHDYPKCLISYRTQNSNWRVLLNGVSDESVALQQVEGTGWLKHKVLVFEKINSHYYGMTVLPEKELKNCKSISKFTARNGITSNGRLFGLLNE